MIFVVYTKENYNYMKKSKIIVPALGLLLLSTAASVSGTVAWFTANRSWNTSISSFAVVSTTGALKGSFESGVGLTASSDKTSLSLVENTVLTHGSVNHDTLLASWPVNDDASKFDSYTITKTAATDGNKTPGTGEKSLYVMKDTNNKEVYTALTFTLKLTYTTSDTSNDYGLFLNLGTSKSNIEKTASAGSGTKDTYKGFRLAFIGQGSDTETVIWADDEVGAKCGYVSEVSSAGAPTFSGTITNGACTATGYSGDKLIASDTTNLAKLASDDTRGTLVDDGVAAATAAGYNNFMGTFKPAGSSADRVLEFFCVAWFEGTDENVITDAKLDTVRADMFFETRKLA